MSKYPNLKINSINIQISVAQYLPRVTWNLKDAQHPSWLFFWNPSGKVKLVFDGEEMIIGQESAVLMPPYTRISAYSETEFSHIYAHFKTGESFCQIRQQPWFLIPDTAEQFFRQRRYAPPQWRSDTYWKILLCEYLMLLPPEAFERSVVSEIDERIARAIQICGSRVLDPPDNAELARMVGMSVNNFYRLFQAEKGISPKRFRDNLRLEFARKMLLESDAKISHVALQCGYADRYQFSKAFKKHFGMTPAAIRKSI